MWLGTHDGLVRFDGRQFKTFKIFKNANKITSLLVSGSGTLWIGSEGGGVACYQGVAFTIKPLAGNSIQTIVEDNRQNIWLGTSGKGIICFKDNHFTSLTTRDGLSDNNVTALMPDDRGNLWVGTENGLNCLTDGKFRLYTVENGLTHPYITALYRDKRGGLLVGTINGIYLISPQAKEKTFKPLEILKGSWIYSLLEDRNGIIWIASDRGLYHVVSSTSTAGDIGDARRFHLNHGYFSDKVISLYEDGEGTLWFGTLGKGLGNFYKSNFKFYTVRHGLSHHHTTAVYQDQSGDIWIGTRGGGLNRFGGKNGKFRTYTGKHGLSSQWITSIYGDGYGNIWIGTPEGLNRFKNGNFKTFTSKDGLSGSFIRSLFVDSSGDLWIGTHGKGLNRYNHGAGKFQIYGTRHGLSNLFVSAITADIDGTLWVGTGEGLYRFHNGRFQCFTGKHGLSGDMISDIYADPEGTLWIAASGGLNRYQNGTFTQCKYQDNPFGISIYRILEDQRRYLWLSTANGIFCVSKREFDYYHFHKGALKTVVFSGECQPAGWCAADGSLWLPTVEGITVIPAGKSTLNLSLHQQVHIERLIVDGMPVNMNAAGPHFFPAGTGKIEFYFNAPNYRAPGVVKYKCRLKGSSYDITGHLWEDRDEIQITGGSRAVYRDLPAGHYVFTIYSSAGPGVWNNQKAASMEFYIRKSFYNTPWFYLLLFIFGLIAAAGILWFIKKRWKEKMMMPIWTHDEKYKTFKLANRESKKYLKEIVGLMEKEKPYLDPDITLSKLAEKLDISKEVLSQVINRELYLNFNAFLNRYRVEEAKKRLRDPKENQFVVLKIALDVGFNSKSSFNAVFKKMTGISPTQYREKYQKNKRT
jgi:ligand-binding sensor domain-containing protein/AraC-like DNA-binding protein